MKSIGTSALLAATLFALGLFSARAVPVEDYLFGTSYYPEQWPKSCWNEDFKKMHDLGFNVVRMGEFAWANFEPSQGNFDFTWMDDAIRLAAENGLTVVLGIPTASVPPWLYKQHPEVMGANEKGAFTYGGRKGFSIESPAMKEAAGILITAMAQHYGIKSLDRNHPLTLN